MSKTAMQMLIDWIEKYEYSPAPFSLKIGDIKAKATELRDTVEREQIELLKRASWLVGNPGTNISGSTDAACDQWQKDYQTYNQKEDNNE